MVIEPSIPLLEEILGEWKTRMGRDYQGYRNHVYRVFHFCLALHESNREDREKFIIAGGFHDLGIWSEGTVDYIAPSIKESRNYLNRQHLGHWSHEITLMIEMHHKLRKCHNREFPLIEVFRRADLIDVSLGAVSWGVPYACIAEVKAQFPNAGFHIRLNELAVRWFFKHPLNPLPFMKW